MKKRIYTFSLIYFFLIVVCFSDEIEIVNPVIPENSNINSELVLEVSSKDLILSENKEFELFSTALSLAKPLSYDSSTDIFNDLKETYSNSSLVKSGIVDFYIGKNLFNQEKYEESIKSFNILKSTDTELNYYIADSYYYLKDEKAFDLFKIIYENSNDPKYTVLALNKLANYDYYYNYLYEIKFLKDFTNLWELTNDDLENISNYFLENYDLKSANLLLEQIMKRKETPITKAKLLFSKKEFEKALDILKTIKSIESYNLEVLIYGYTENENNERLAMVNIIKEDPNSDLAAKYRFELYEKEKNTGYLKWILVYNQNSPYYLNALQIYGKEYISNFEEKQLRYKSLIERLEYLKTFNIKSLCLIELENSIFEENDKLFKDYLISIYK